jgi:hypothetical protein
MPPELPKPLQAEVDESVRLAFFCKNFKFTESLRYSTKHAESLNNAEFEPALQHLSKENQRQLRKFREIRTLPPVILKHSDKVGFDCVAACDLPELTLLCEYLGDVKTDREISQSEELQKNDSIMGLLENAKDAEMSLNVCPVEHANVARFFNGINNQTVGSKQIKQNVRTMRC